MNISIGKNGQYERDQEALEFLSPTEDEYLAALAQRLVIRQEQIEIKKQKQKQKEEAKQREREEKRKQKELERQKIFSDLLDGKRPNY